MSKKDDLDRSMKDELKEVYARLERISRIKSGVCSTYVGKVYNGGSLPSSADRYVLTNPVSISGNETEGTASTLIVDTGRSVPVLVIGSTPVVGDILPADLIDGRWIAEKRPGGTGGGIVIGIPGCFCQGTPFELNLTVSYSPGFTAADYGNAYQDCVLNYYSVGPLPYQPLEFFPGPGYYSTTAWVDDYGFLDYFKLQCFASQYSLGIGQYGGGVWQSPGQLFNWAMVARPQPNNFCSPFLLSQGTNQPGINFSGQFIITG